ncbi:MAG: hypothetical protein FWF24_07670 [Alphaproteobacteria bacterium]|nr:hypothetical protein [Alphaproteobacteria bacterium]
MDQQERITQIFEQAKKIVVKCGTDVVVEHEMFRRYLAADIRDLTDEGKGVVLVSSGAIGYGKREYAELNKIDLSDIVVEDKVDKQFFSVLGQKRLMRKWEHAFATASTSLGASQHLLTNHDFNNEEQAVNLKQVVERTIKRGIIPVINANDATSQDALINDNDDLATRITLALDADLLIILSSGIDGLYKDYGKTSQELVTHVPKITKDIRALVDPTSFTAQGTGGMHSKILAAEYLLEAGHSMIIARGTGKYAIRGLRESSRPCTLFSPD